MTRTWNAGRQVVIYGIGALGMICVALLWMAGCKNPPPSDQQVKDQAAKTTEQVKTGAQQAAADTRAAAAQAEQKLNDVAAGVKEGLHNQASSANGQNVDINGADETQLETLPGITPVRARRIIHNRPYAAPHDLVSKGVVSEAEYSRISGQVVANQ